MMAPGPWDALGAVIALGAAGWLLTVLLRRGGKGQ